MREQNKFKINAVVLYKNVVYTVFSFTYREDWDMFSYLIFDTKTFIFHVVPENSLNIIESLK